MKKSIVSILKLKPKKKDGVLNHLNSAVLSVLKPLGGLGNFIKKGDTVLIKPAYNSADPYPVSSDVDFVKTVISLVFRAGAKRIIVGESSGPPWNTKKVFEKTGLKEMIERIDYIYKYEGKILELHSFNDYKWIPKKVEGQFIKSVDVAEDFFKVDKIIYLPCMKTHFSAKFSLSLKLAMGNIKISNRWLMHTFHLEEKIADINLAVKPSLIIMDARKCLVTGGPWRGEVKSPNLILASDSQVAIDVEALKILQSYKEYINKGNRLILKPWEFRQIKSAVELGLGNKVKSEKDYVVKKV